MKWSRASWKGKFFSSSWVLECFLFCFVFEKMSSSLPMLLVMLLAHVGKRSNSRSQMFFKTGVLKYFAIFTEKHLCWSLFLIKFQDWRSAFLFKKKLLFNHFAFTEICKELKLQREACSLKYPILESERPFAFFDYFHGKWCKLGVVLCYQRSINRPFSL